MLLNMQKKKNNENQEVKNKRFLITVNVLGSAGPLRFLVNENDSAGWVIYTALRLYARQGRLPVHGSNVTSFLLYPANAELDALSPGDSIGSQAHHRRTFLLCKKQPEMTEPRSEIIARKMMGSSLANMIWFQHCHEHIV